MNTPAVPAVPVSQPSTSKWRWALVLALFLGISLGLLAWFFAREASRYTLEIPMRTAVPQTTQLMFWYEGDTEHGVLVGPFALQPTEELKIVRFPLGKGTIANFQFDPMLAEGAADVGAPVVRCNAYSLLGFDIPFHEFQLSDLILLHQLVSGDQEGDHLHMVTTPDADISICGITPAEPMRLGFNHEAFILTFVPVAFGWTFLVLLASLLVVRYSEGWRARLPELVPVLLSSRQAARALPRLWPALLAALLSFRPAVRGPLSRWEKWAVTAIFVVTAAVTTNAILHGGTKGQDYPYFFDYSVRIVEHPNEPWIFCEGDPPIFVLTNAFFIWLTGGVNSQEVCGFFNLLVNLVGLWFLYLLARRFIAGGVWRVALMTLVAFLPVRLIASIVLVGDALVQWPFFILAWVLAALTDEDIGRTRRRWLAVGCCALLTVGVLTKYTFMSALVAVVLTFGQLARRGRIPWREAVLLSAIAISLPVGVVVKEQRSHPDFSGTMALSFKEGTSMGVRDIAWVHSRDVRIFDAPPYNEPEDGHPWVSSAEPDDPDATYELLVDHRYSYLALNHWAAFTDPMNIFQYDPTDAYFGARSDRNQRLMARAVKTSVPITLVCVAAAGLLSVLLLAAGLAVPGRSRPDLEAVWLLAFGWFTNIVLFLPFVYAAYIAGLFLPRLTLPALLTFLMLTVYVLERLLPERAGRVTAWVVLVYVVCQSALQISFLWPWGPTYRVPASRGRPP